MFGRNALLAVDGIVNLALGLLLLAFPARLVALLGLPDAAPAFYPSLLGAVLIGIGVALLVELREPRGRPGGLGLGGAIAINLCGAAALAGWLLSGPLSLPPRGLVLLWALVVLLVGLSAAELASRARPHGEVDG